MWEVVFGKNAKNTIILLYLQANVIMNVIRGFQDIIN